MTHQNHQTNGASLEDCHTNFFALTELYGIKWRKLVWGESGASGPCNGGETDGSAPLADPVISSYARCLAGDILCVWRRVPAPQQSQDMYELTVPTPTPPPLSLRAAKELWIFWYGEEPDLNGLVAPELLASQGEQGSWESGLSYECRSLLFKALHNLIERCLLSRDFVRLGKWFVQPYDGDEEDVGKSPWHLSFSFAFFLHGESTVCASVDVRQHPPVRTLTAARLKRITSHQHDKVILAPFGLEGTVTGREWSDTEPATARLLDAWRHLYPLHSNCGAVEVACGGVRMRYPRAYVLQTEMEEEGGERGSGDATSLAAAVKRALHQPQQNCTSVQTTEVCNGDASPEKMLIDDFVDPTRKTPCTCAKSCAGACSPGSPASPPAPPSAPSPAHQPSPHPHHVTTQPQASSCVTTALHTPAPTPDPLAPNTPATNTKLYNQSESPRCAAASVGAGVGGGGGGGAGAGGGSSGGGCVSGARPLLRAPDTTPDVAALDTPLAMLYDYSTVDAWLEHPVKRFKTSEKFCEEMALGTELGSDLYAGHQHIKMAADPPKSMFLNEKQEPNEDVKEYKNLFTSDGLCPTLKDLDQIFDNSDDASGDETGVIQGVSTPPDSNKSLCESVCGVVGGGLPTELSKMFPTPPSMEAHAQPSPGFSLPDELHARTPPPDPIDDWSYVFKPPTVCRAVGSSKYAPLAVLPSQLLPPLPPHPAYRPAPPPSNTHRLNSTLQETRADTRAPPTPRGGVCPGAGRAPPARSPHTPAPAPAPAPPHAHTHAPPPAPPPAPAPAPRAAACPLLLNVLLADTLLNIFRDHNFDSCTLCVCNAGPKVVGNIRGADASIYLPSSGPGDGTSRCGGHDEEPCRCSCGFSAIVNRRLAHRAGLFHEDERDITGRVDEPTRPNYLLLRNGTDDGTQTENGADSEMADVAELVSAACASLPGGSACALSRAAAAAAAAASAAAATSAAAPPLGRLNVLEYWDGGAAAALALRAAAAPLANVPTSPAAVHRWPFIGARAPRSSRDVVRLMRRLRPLLQDAIQKRCCGTRMWDGVSGPLTWRQFHRLAGRGNEDLCEPQPVPALLVGHEREWLHVSPYALRHWERLALEPYSSGRDVVYAALCVEAGGLTEPLHAFLRDLSAAYETCRLGRHRAAPPLLPTAPAFTAPRRAQQGVSGEAWSLEHDSTSWIGALANTARTRLIPALAGPLELDSSGEGTPALVVYVVSPPAAPASRPGALRDLLALAKRIRQALQHHNALVKIISLEGIMEWWSGGSKWEVRSLAFSVFTGCRRLLTHQPNGKSLTGFGTAANDALFLNSKDEKNRAGYQLFTPAWVVSSRTALSGVGAEWSGGGAAGGGGGDTAEGGVLFLAYCLSHDQRWLLAAATDARGELLDTAAINIAVPPTCRRRRGAPARRLGLTKLMDFILGVMSQTAQPWRLVVGRIGRIGHGELKGWSWLLSRKNLSRAGSMLREACGACASGLSPPCIISACLVSTEPDARLRLMADRFTPDERFSQQSIQSHLHTPRDVTATHILVFPTSATTQSNQMPFEPPANGEDNDMMFGIDIADEEGDDNMAMTDLFSNDMFSMWAPNSPRASPRRNDSSREGSPARLKPPPYSSQDDLTSENVGTVLQQPLALGYLVSTAPLGGMPAWWWGGSLHLRDSCPAFLKNALHLHAGSSDELPPLHSAHNSHPLDSHTTTDVLRYVLEGYNSLSWLVLDGSTNDRRSCLPFHVQILMQLYHTAAALG